MGSETSELIDVEVVTKVSTLGDPDATRNSICVTLNEVVEELFDGEERGSGTVTHLEPSHVTVEAYGWSKSHIAQLLRAQRVPCSPYLGRMIALSISHSLAYDPSVEEPVLARVSVNYFIERRILLPPPVPTPDRGAPWNVFKRLASEQRVTQGQQEEACSICMEDLSRNLIVMPLCSHMFHEHCLFLWLCRQNSCPLCRSIPYPEDQEA